MKEYQVARFYDPHIVHFVAAS